MSDRYEDVPVLVHVGPHKTGTSWLQKKLLLQAQGIVYGLSFTPSHQAFLLPRPEDFSTDEARALFAPMLEKARAESKPFVISDEALGGRPFGQRFVRNAAAERIARTFPHAQILITTRTQNSVILSMYSEYLRYGFASSLQGFLSQDTGNPNIQPLLDLRSYEWDRFIRIYEGYFPSEQVHAVPMEWGLKDATHYPGFLEKLLGRPLDISADLEVSSVERESFSGWALEALRHANKLYPQDSRYQSKGGRFSPNSIAYQVNRLTPKAARANSKTKMRQIVSEAIADRFAASNRRFQERVPYDLAELGYDVGPEG